MLKEKMPNEWVNPKLQKIVEALLDAEDDFREMKTSNTLNSILITLANIFKSDAKNISTILSRQSVLLERNVSSNTGKVKIINPNPNNAYEFNECSTCTGSKQIVRRTTQTPQLNPQSVLPQLNQTGETQEEDLMLKQIIPEESLVVSKDHSEGLQFKAAIDVWKYYSGDLAKLKEAAKLVGVDATYDSDSKALAKKIFAKLNQQK